MWLGEAWYLWLPLLAGTLVSGGRKQRPPHPAFILGMLKPPRTCSFPEQGTLLCKIRGTSYRIRNQDIRGPDLLCDLPSQPENTQLNIPNGSQVAHCGCLNRKNMEAITSKFIMQIKVSLSLAGSHWKLEFDCIFRRHYTNRIRLRGCIHLLVLGLQAQFILAFSSIGLDPLAPTNFWELLSISACFVLRCLYTGLESEYLYTHMWAWNVYGEKFFLLA